VTQRAFWIGLICGAVAGAGLVWWLDPRAVPSAELNDARRAAQTGKWEVVRSVLGRYLRRFPEDPEAQVLLARSEAAQGNLAACIARLGNISESSSWSAEARLCEAQAHLMGHFGARAEKAFLRAIEAASAGDADPRIAEAARVGLAQIYGLEVRYESAREQLMQVLKTTEYPAGILSLLFQIEALGTDPQQAIDSLQKFVQNDASDFEARRALGYHYAVLGRTGEARTLLEACLAERPDDARAAEPLAQCLVDLPDLDGCRKLLDEVAPHAQDKSWYWRQRGYLAEQELDWTAASGAYGRAVELAPSDPMVHHLLAAVLVRLNDASRAQELRERAAQLRATRQTLPDLYARLIATGVQATGPGPSPELCYILGTACQKLTLPEAEEWFREALRRNPNDAPSRAALERLGQIDGSDEARAAGGSSDEP
jgi:tetratricopeptide (TPR) repeat protein